MRSGPYTRSIHVAPARCPIQTIGIRHIDGPQGVRGRNSDNTRLREVLGWEPAIDLEEGLVGTYRWIESRVRGGERSAVEASAAVA